MRESKTIPVNYSKEGPEEYPLEFPIILHLKLIIWDFLGGPVVKAPPFHRRDLGSIPGQPAEIPHAA